MSQTEPGWYYTDGDPPGTKRYWNGSQWVGDPTTQQPSYAGSGHNYAGAGIRLGARIIDAILVFIILMILAAIFGFGSATTSDGSFSFSTGTSAGFIIAAILVGVLYEIGLVATRGATLGKQMLGLKVLDESHNTPPGWGPAAMRWLPALAGNIPGIGPLIGLGLAIASGVMISNDDQNRSVQDRIGKTYVVKTK